MEDQSAVTVSSKGSGLPHQVLRSEDHMPAHFKNSEESPVLILRGINEVYHREVHDHAQSLYDDALRNFHPSLHAETSLP